MATGRVTIQDLADSLGLSKFSVSRALSGKPGVGEDTRNRVLRTARSMGYRAGPEPSASSGHILFIRQEIDPVSSELWLNIMQGAEQEGEKLGFTIMPRQARYLNEASQLDSAVVGIILAVPRPSEWSGLASRTGLPVVCASYVGPMERIDQVVGADWEAGYGVARLLVGLGHRKMAFVHGSVTPAGRAERFRGFADGARETHGSTVDDIVFDEEIGFRSCFIDYLRAGGAPTALFCAHDGIAIAVVSELLRAGVRIPEDVSVVGFNDFASAMHVSPRLTTVRTPQTEMGAAMVRQIAERLASPDARTRPPARIALVAEIITRESTGPVGKGDWRRRLLEEKAPK